MQSGSSPHRAAHYREQEAQLRGMADAASDEILAAKLATWPRNTITLRSEQNRPVWRLRASPRLPACHRGPASYPDDSIDHWRLAVFCPTPLRARPLDQG